MDVSIDSQILSFFLKRNPPGPNNPNQDVAEMYRRSRILIHELKHENARIIISTIVIAELLIGVEQRKHGDFIATLQSLFAVIPFDIRATSLAAELWMSNQTAPPEEKIERRYLKSDVLIVASARAAGVKIFYSHDTKCRKLAEKAGMIGRDLPETSKYLFEISDLDETPAKPSGQLLASSSEETTEAERKRKPKK